MRIGKIDVKGFAGLEPGVREPHPGLNLIHGPNESGKSSLMAFIQAMFYGLKGGRAGRDGVPAALKRHAPWNGGPYAGILEYALEDGSRFRIGRNFEKGLVNLHDEHANNVTGQFPLDRDAGPRFAETHLGVDADAFVRTMFVPQQETALDGSARRMLHERLVSFQTTGDEELSLDRALNALRRAAMEQVGSERSTTRPLDRIRARLERLEDELGRERDRRDAHLTMLADRDEVRERLAETGVRLTRLQTLRREAEELKNAARTAERRENLEQLTESLEENRSLAAEAGKRQAALKARIVQMEAFDRLHAADPARIQELPVDFGRLTVLRESLARTEARLAGENELLRGYSRESGQELRLLAESERLDELVREWNEAQEALGGADERSRLLKAVRSGASTPFARFSMILALAALLSLVLFGVGSVMSLELVMTVGIVGLAAALPGLGIVLLLQNREWNRPPADMGPENRWREISRQMDQTLRDMGARNVPDLIRLRQEAESRAGRLRAIRLAIERVEDERRSLIGEKQQLEARISGMLQASGIRADADFGEEDVARFAAMRDALLADKAALEAEAREIENLAGASRSILREAALLTGLRPTTIEDMRDLSEKAQMEWNRVAARCRTDAEPADPAEFDEPIRLCEEQVHEMNLRLRELETRLEDLPREERLQEVSEEIDRLRELSAQLEAHAAAIELAIDGLETAGRVVKRDFAPQFNADVARVLSTLTGGRHASVRADDRFTLQVEAPGSTEIVPVQLLSGGTIDQAYLAMRLAAVFRMETGGEKLPIFLDEPFAQYDEDRMLRALELIRELAAERQVFLFTCRARERDAAVERFGEGNLTVWELGRTPVANSV